MSLDPVRYAAVLRRPSERGEVSDRWLLQLFRMLRVRNGDVRHADLSCRERR